MNIFVDMDGTLVTYNRHDMMTERFNIPNLHYFRDLPPDTRMVAAARYLVRTKKYPLSILTTIMADKRMHKEHIKDKSAWAKDHLPELDLKTGFIPVSIPKPEAIQKRYNRKLTPLDILIDDYNYNLVAWEKAGGTAIKYGNGINDTTSFDGLSIKETDSVSDILLFLDKLEEILKENPNALKRKKGDKIQNGRLIL